MPPPGPPGPPGPPPGFPAAESFGEVYGPYLRQPAIESIFLYPWDTGYEGNGTEKGSITWVEGKPVITGRVSLWQEDGCTPKGGFGSPGCRNARGKRIPGSFSSRRAPMSGSRL